MAGKIQDQDVKSAAELVSAGATAASLINDTKIYVTGSGINDTLANAITNGQIGSGGTGTNYIPSQISQGKTITGITTYLDSSPGATPTGTVSGASVSTLVSSTDSSLVSTTNLLWTKSAASRLGEGFYIPFTIDTAYRAKPFTISLIYSIASGTFASGDQTIWIQDVTNSTFIQPTGSSIINSVGATVQTASFQASFNSSSYRLYVHTSTASALAYSIRFDSISVSPNTYNWGAAVMEWVAYTPTISAGFGTTTNSTFFYRRVGGSLEVQGSFTTGTPAASIATVTLPTGLALDTSKIGLANTTSGNAPIWGQWEASGAANLGPMVTATGTSSSLLYFAAASGVNQLTPQNGTGIVGTTAVVALYFEVPILGWGVSQVLSSDTDTRVVAASYYASTTGTVSSAAPINFDSKIYDTHGAVTTGVGSWKFTAPVPGKYNIGGDMGSTTSSYFFVYKGAVLLTSIGYAYATASGMFQPNIDIDLLAGETIDIRSATSVTWSGGSYATAAVSKITIKRLSGPAQIAASEKISVLYTQSVAVTTTSYNNPMRWTTKVVDTHGAFDTTNGRFTAPRGGTFEIRALLAAGALSNSYTYKNGAQYLGAGLIATNTSTIIGVVPLLAGEYVDIRTDNQTASANATHYISITSQG